MEGSFFLGDGKFETRELPSHPLGDREVLIKVAACGVCGTDVHIYHGDKGSADVLPPVILGHELSGIVVEAGSGCTRVKPGDHVTVDPNIYCGECYYCRKGKKQLCTGLRAVGVNMNGGFADYCYVPESQLYLLDETVPLEIGAMAEPLACCIHGIDRADIHLGDNVCVIGGGAIGLLMVQLAKLKGAAQVILSEPVEERRMIGLAVGADHAIDPVSSDPVSAVRDILGSDGADVVIECVGNTIAVKQAFAVAAKGAHILIFSVPKAGSHHELSLEDVYQKELTIAGSMINPDTHQRAVDLINSGRLHIKEIITHHFPYSRLEDAILMQMSSESIKVIVRSE